MARHFQYNVKVFFEDIILDGPLGKTKYYAIHIELQEKSKISILLNGFSIHQIFVINLSILGLLRKQ